MFRLKISYVAMQLRFEFIHASMAIMDMVLVLGVGLFASVH